METNRTAIKLVGVTKIYSIHHEKPTLAERIFDHKNENFTALKNLSLIIKKGEKVGIIGANGSGKTTLLKLITGISTPTKGEVCTFGKVVSLIDLEAGFHPELTGIQNIYLNGSVLGMSNKQISDNLDKIISFANIGKFIDVPLFTYSEGMKIRLGFSVAIHSDPDILVLDENMAVGDENFRKLCYQKLKEFYKEGKTVIIASHDLDYIKQNCNRVIELRKGKIKRSGSSARTILLYKRHS
jgi:ABC-type polysaccharide/polyol phosphate transport system ATPase subunit